MPRVVSDLADSVIWLILLSLLVSGRGYTLHNQRKPPPLQNQELIYKAYSAVLLPVLWSRSRRKSHHLGGAGAVTRSGSGSGSRSGSKGDI
jgi:hypothetical protein